MSPELKQFYRDMLQWVDSGFESPHEHGYFEYRRGLCGNLDMWCLDNVSPQQCEVLHLELITQFKTAGLNVLFPFDANREDYRTCYIYANPRRLAWIKEHAK